MKKYSLLIPFISLVASFNLVKPNIANALERSEISALAKQYTVLIDGEETGSGAIIDKDDDTYTVLTNWHVVDTPGKYQIVTPDKEKYRVVYNQIRYLPEIDLAIVKFKSNKDYTVAELGNSDEIVEGGTIYLAAYPDPFPGVPQRIYLFFSTEVNGKLSEAEQGYTLLFAQSGTPGTSGGPLVDNNGRVVGVNGKASWEITTGSSFGLGIPLKLYMKEKKNLSPPTGIAPQEDFVTLGKKKAKDGDYRGAIKLYDRALEVDANNRDAYLQRGIAHFHLKDYQSAQADAEQILQNNPKDAYAYLLRGDTFAFQKEYQKALKDFNQALKLDSNLEALVYTDRGGIYSKLGDNQKALADLDRAIQLNPNLGIAYINRCAVYTFIQQFDRAIADCNEAIWMGSDLPDNFLAFAYSNRGRAYLSGFQDTQKALADASKANELNSDLYEVYVTNSSIYVELKEYEKALADASKAIELNPNNYEGYVNRSAIYAGLKEYDKAIADANKAIELNPDRSEGYVNRSLVYGNSGEYQKELRDLNKAIELNPNDYKAYVNRAVNYSLREDYDKALVDSNKVVSIIPESPKGYFLRGIMYHLQENYQLALAEYQQALTKDEKFIPAIGNIGLVKYEQGETEAAIQQWKSVLVIDPEYAASQMATAVALYAQGNQSRAFRMAQSALRIDQDFADLEDLKKNLWGEKIIADTQKLLETPEMKQFISSITDDSENKHER